MSREVTGLLGFGLGCAFAALLSLLGGCAPTVRGTTYHSPDGVLVATSAWRERGLPDLGPCGGELARLRFVLSSDAQVRYASGYCASGGPTCEATRGDGMARAQAGCAFGTCVAGVTLRNWTPAGYVSVVVLSGYLDETMLRSTVLHEMMHVLSACTSGDTDAAHSRPEIWQPGGALYCAGGHPSCPGSGQTQPAPF